MSNIILTSDTQIEVYLDARAGIMHGVPMDYTNNPPDISKVVYLEGAVPYFMWVQPVGSHNGEDMYGLWCEEYLVGSGADINWYRFGRRHRGWTGVTLVHRMMRSAYQRNATYARVAGMEIHHDPPRNGMFALMFGDRISTPMLTNGTFNETTFNFLKQDDEWYDEYEHLKTLTPYDHACESWGQKTYPFYDDIPNNIRARCDGTYPKNPYYKFEDNMSIVNERYLFGEPRYSQKEFW